MKLSEVLEHKATTSFVCCSELNKSRMWKDNAVLRGWFVQRTYDQFWRLMTYCLLYSKTDVNIWVLRCSEAHIQFSFNHKLRKIFSASKQELYYIDMVINVSKTCCMRAGNRYKMRYSSITASLGLVMPWVDEVKWRGSTFVASYALKCNFRSRQTYLIT